MSRRCVGVGDIEAGGDAGSLGEGTEHGGSGRDGGIDVNVGAERYICELEGEVIDLFILFYELKYSHHTRET